MRERVRAYRVCVDPVYLDNNATTRPCDAAREATLRTIDEYWQNPSSVHRGGQAARQSVELARRSVAGLVNCKPREVVFTSGATEALDLAIKGVLDAAPAERDAIVTTPIEHEAVRDTIAALARHAARPIEVRTLPLLEGGVINAAALRELLEDQRVAIVCAQWANNETGAIQPVHAIGEACRDAGVPYLCDATQWVGKMPTDLDQVPIDLAACSAHKMHGPKGVGALIARRGVRLRPQLRGSQELERRGGTENVPGIVGFGAAAEYAAQWLAYPGERERLTGLRDRFERAILDAVPDASINGPTTPGARLWNTTNIAFPPLEAEALLLLLSERSVYASAGAACSSGSLDPSPVLLAMGIEPTRAHGSLRFSLSRETSDHEIDRAIEVVRVSVERLRSGVQAAL